MTPSDYDEATIVLDALVIFRRRAVGVGHFLDLGLGHRANGTRQTASDFVGAVVCDVLVGDDERIQKLFKALSGGTETSVA